MNIKNLRNQLMGMAMISTAVGATAHAGETEILVGVAAGGGYDAAARLMAKYLPKYLDESSTNIVRNVVGASSLNLAKMMEAEGTDDQLGIILSSLIVSSKTDPERVGIDFSKFHWIGSINAAISICLTGADTGIHGFDEFINKDFKVGATTQNGGFYKIASTVKNIFGAKYEIITGFKGSRDIEAAVDRGEIQGYCGSQLDTFLKQEQSKTRNMIAALSQDLDIDGKIVASVLSRVVNEKDAAALQLLTGNDVIYYSVLMGPNASNAAVARYQEAFEKTIRDPEFISAAHALFTSFEPMTGAEVAGVVAEITKTDQAVVERLAAIARE